ncbi:MAG: hypothetical protein V2G42_08385 [bacterium JZ-2024 1]
MKRILFGDFLLPFILFWLILKEILPVAFERWEAVSLIAPSLIASALLCLWAILTLVIFGSVERPPLFYLFLVLGSLAPLLPAQFFPPIPEVFMDLYRWGLLIGVTGLIARYMAREIILLPLTLVAITLDAFAFLRGVYPRLLELPAFAPFYLPLASLPHAPPAPPFTPVLLYTDLFFIGYFFVCCYEMRLNRFWNAILLLFATSAALLIPATFGTRYPVLPVFGFLFLAGNWRSLKFQKDEIGISFAFFAAMILLLGITLLTGR